MAVEWADEKVERSVLL
jgi:hypothetical protein